MFLRTVNLAGPGKARYDSANKTCCNSRAELVAGYVSIWKPSYTTFGPCPQAGWHLASGRRDYPSERTTLLKCSSSERIHPGQLAPIAERNSWTWSKSLTTARACLERRGVLMANTQTGLSHLIIGAVTNGLTARHQRHRTGDEAPPLRARSSGGGGPSEPKGVGAPTQRRRPDGRACWDGRAHHGETRSRAKGPGNAFTFGCVASVQLEKCPAVGHSSCCRVKGKGTTSPSSRAVPALPARARGSKLLPVGARLHRPRR